MGIIPKKHAFNGEQMTIAEIHAMVPAIGKGSIARHLAAGRNTTAAMLNFDQTHTRKASGRKAAKNKRFHNG